MPEGIGHLAALGGVAPAFHLHGDELGGAFTVAHDGLRQLPRDVDQRLAQYRAVTLLPLRDGRDFKLNFMSINFCPNFLATGLYVNTIVF